MKPSIIIPVLLLLVSLGCQKNNADEENFGYCFAYHSTITQMTNKYELNFQQILTRIDPNLANDFAMRWIREYYESTTDAEKQQKLSQAKKSCGRLGIPNQ